MDQEFKIIGMCVCVNYDDYLRSSLPLNISHFDKFVIATSENDYKTIQFVREFRRTLPKDKRKLLKLFKTNLFYQHNDVFNKGAVLRYMQENYLKIGDWGCIIDADIVLPENFRKACETQCVNKEYLYGAKRINFDKYEDFEKNVNGYKIKEKVGLGFLQIYNNSENAFKYPKIYPTAGQCDIVFKKNWDKSQIKKLNFNVKHLGKQRVNWKGRKSKQWG